jgi:hypothetical protein
MDNIRSAAARLIKKHNGVRAAARATGLDAGYLVRLRDGLKINPGDDVLEKLGINRRVTYTRLRGTA